MFLVKRPDTSNKNQHTISSYASVGVHTLLLSVSYQSTSHHGITDVNNNDDSQTFEILRKSNIGSSCFDNTLTTTTTKTSSKLTLPGKEYLCFQSEGKTFWAAKCAKSIALTKVLKTTFEIESFEQKCVIIKDFLKYEKLKNTCLLLEYTNN